ILLGMWAGKKFPRFAVRADKPMRIIPLLGFLGLVATAFLKNRDLLAQALTLVAPLVIAHNATALPVGTGAARLARPPRDARRAVTMEVGIQNSGLGLTLLFTFFPAASGMIFIAACWGIWHLVSGLTLALLWSRRPA